MTEETPQTAPAVTPEPEAVAEAPSWTGKEDPLWFAEVERGHQIEAEQRTPPPPVDEPAQDASNTD